jgi:hypothetical protein
MTPHPSLSRRGLLLPLTCSLLLAVPTVLAQDKPTAPAQAKTAPPPSAPTAASAAPAAAEIFAKAAAAAGGADLIRSQKSQTLKGTLEMPGQGLKGSIVTRSNDPDQLLIETEIPGFGKILQGVQGTVGWSIDPLRGPSLMDKDELARTIRDLSIDKTLDPSKDCTSVIVDGESTFANTRCWKVTLECDGTRSTRFYAQDKGHMVGQTTTVKSALGEFEVTTTFSDFAAFDGRTIPKVTKNSMMGQEQVMTITEASFAPIDATTFSLPPEIKALTQAGAATQQGAAPKAAPPKDGAASPKGASKGRSKEADPKTP